MQNSDGRRVSDDALEVLRGRAVAIIEAGRRSGRQWRCSVFTTTPSGAGSRPGRRRAPRGCAQEAWPAPGRPYAAAPDAGSRDQEADHRLVSGPAKPPFALCNREAVQALIARRFAIDLALYTVGSYLRRWGFSPQRPVKRAL